MCELARQASYFGTFILAGRGKSGTARSSPLLPLSEPGKSSYIHYFCIGIFYGTTSIFRKNGMVDKFKNGDINDSYVKAIQMCKYFSLCSQNERI